MDFYKSNVNININIIMIFYVVRYLKNIWHIYSIYVLAYIKNQPKYTDGFKNTDWPLLSKPNNTFIEEKTTLGITPEGKLHTFIDIFSIKTKITNFHFFPF